MKRLAYIVMLSLGALQAEEQPLSKGAVTEALFIIQNKHNELSDYIARLKNLLAPCMLLAQEKKLSLNAKRDLVVYQCPLREKLFSKSINELEQLASMLESSLAELSSPDNLSQSSLRARVDFAFLVKRKIDTEYTLIEHLLKCQRDKSALERAQKSLEASLKKSEELKKQTASSTRYNRRLNQADCNISFLKRVIRRLGLEIDKSQKSIKNLKEAVREIDLKLYKERALERVNVLLEENI